MDRGTLVPPALVIAILIRSSPPRLTSDPVPGTLRGAVHFGPEIYLLFFGVALAAGFVDSIAGGGGLITIPALVSLGLPPQAALGTNKLQACFGSGSATRHFFRAGLIDWRRSGVGVGMTAAGAALGSAVVQQLSASLLQQLIPWLLLGIALYTWFQPRLGEADAHPRIASRWFLPLFGVALGFYDGFFGPGTGSFWAIAFVLGQGFNLTKATAHTKLMNFTSNVASLAVFLHGGQVNLSLGLVMGAGQLLGARWGAGMVVRRGARFIRPVFITVALAITGRLLWRNWTG